MTAPSCHLFFTRGFVRSVSNELLQAAFARWISALIVSSFLTCLGLYLWFRKKFKGSYRLIAAACLAEAWFYCLEGKQMWAGPMVDCINLHLRGTRAEWWVTPFLTKPFDKIMSYNYQYAGYLTWMMVELYLNTAYFVDVYLTMKNPFVPSHRRHTMILLFTPFVYVFTNGMVYVINFKLDLMPETVVPLTLLPIPVLITIWAVASIITRLRMKSTSRELKS